MVHRRRRLFIASSALFLIVLTAGIATALPGGIGGDQGAGDVSVAGCTCHAAEPNNDVTVLIDGVSTMYVPATTYSWTIQIIGGPEILSASNTAGFSMRVTAGTLAAAAGSEALVQNWQNDEMTLTHTKAGAQTEDRTWHITWTAPEAGTGTVTIHLVGNSVNGADGNQGDSWNRLNGIIDEGSDDGVLRMIYAGNGVVEPPAPATGEIDLHEMGAAFRAHWLGLLGFSAVIIVLIFCGFFLRYGFSSHYVGRSNLLQLRIKHLRRGDQL